MICEKDSIHLWIWELEICWYWGVSQFVVFKMHLINAVIIMGGITRPQWGWEHVENGIFIKFTGGALYREPIIKVIEFDYLNFQVSNIVGSWI